jgi:hypothetical protein
MTLHTFGKQCGQPTWRSISVEISSSCLHDATFFWHAVRPAYMTLHTFGMQFGLPTWRCILLASSSACLHDAASPLTVRRSVSLSYRATVCNLDYLHSVPVVNLHILQKGGNFLTSLVTVSVSRRTLLHGVSDFIFINDWSLELTNRTGIGNLRAACGPSNLFMRPVTWFGN